jgi:hypothetical protein
MLPLTKDNCFGGLPAMKHLALVLVLCAAGLAAAPRTAYAFDIEGQNASLQDGSSHFASPSEQLFNPDYSKGSSLALPFIGNSDSSMHISDYGNSIAIPGPGIDTPAPAWAYSAR